MPATEPNPRQMLALILGASRFTRAPKLAQGKAFFISANDFNEYLTGADGLNLPTSNVAWLFDGARSANDQLQQIAEFLDRRSNSLSQQGNPPRDLIVYYVGHGLFAGAKQRAGAHR